MLPDFYVPGITMQALISKWRALKVEILCMCHTTWHRNSKYVLPVICLPDVTPDCDWRNLMYENLFITQQQINYFGASVTQLSRTCTIG